MIYAALTTLLALAPMASARRLDTLYAQKSQRKLNQYTKTESTHTSRSYCEARATTENFSIANDAHAAAFTKAWAYACDEKHPIYDKYYWVYIYEHMANELKKYDSGFAFAKAIATAEVYCNSEGNAYGCAAAYAKAQAWAKASIRAHARAWAKAVGKCKCNGKKQTVEAITHNYASQVKKIVAKVEAHAKAAVCVKGDDEAYDYDAQTCIQDIYATAWAQAIAVASIDGVCVHEDYPYDPATYGDLTADALSYAEAEIKVTEIKGCVDYVDYYYTPQYYKHYYK